MTKEKFSSMPIDTEILDFETNTEWYGLASATNLPSEHYDGLKKYLDNAVNVFVASNYVRLIREYQDGLDRGCHFRLHPNSFYTTDEFNDGFNSADYPEYYDRNGNEIPRPKNAKYAKGDVVMVSNEDNNGVAIVLGCICEDGDLRGDLRLDLCGMTNMDHVRHATKDDILADNSRHGSSVRNALGL